MTHDSKYQIRTLWFAGALHAFTHVYQVALLPLYLPIQADLQLRDVGQATFLVTALMIAYFVPSYPMGILADRISRKSLLGVGLVVNALGFVGLAFAQNYGAALTCMIIAGFGGSFFHPAATALVAQMFPERKGRALGLVGIGASVGFFAGPIYAGWRGSEAGWRTPVLELGIFGLIAAMLFIWLAEEKRIIAVPEDRNSRKMFAGPALWVAFIAACFAFTLRDFAGSSMGTLGSLFMQSAHGFDLKTTGLAVSGIFIASAISNPLFGGLSDRGRLRWTGLVLVLSAVLVLIFPRVPTRWLIPVLIVYGFFFLSNYPMVEAALMESVPDSVRGRVFGIFITIGGLVGNLSHWIVGEWFKRLGDAASSHRAYYGVYGWLALLILLSLAGLPCLYAIRKRERPGEALDAHGALDGVVRNPLSS